MRAVIGVGSSGGSPSSIGSESPPPVPLFARVKAGSSNFVFFVGDANSGKAVSKLDSGGLEDKQRVQRVLMRAENHITDNGALEQRQLQSVIEMLTRRASKPELKQVFVE